MIKPTRLPPTLEERVRAKARHEAEMDIAVDFARVKHFAKPGQEQEVLKAMEARATEQAVMQKEDEELRKLARRLDSGPGLFTRLKVWLVGGPSL